MGLFNFNKNKEEDSAKTASSDDGSGSSDNSNLEAALNKDKKDMIRGIEDLSETTVKEVMIPRIDVDFLSIDTPPDELMTKIAASGHSRFPVYSESVDNVVGVLYVKDLIKVFSQHESADLGKIMKKAYFIPESKRIDTLLREFKREHLHIAIAIDEYGGMSGIVCMEDIIEEIVGDIQDEFDEEQDDISSAGENMWVCQARVDLDDFNEKIGANLPAEDFDTLGGFVFDLFGKIPVKYEKVSWQDFDFIVQDMAGHRINVIKAIRRISADDNNDGGK